MSTQEQGAQVTSEWLAAQTFNPWSKSDCPWEPPTLDQWNDLGRNILPFLRTAHAAMFKTKEELATLAEELNQDAFEKMIRGFQSIEDLVQPILKIAQSAEVRCMAGYAVIAEREDEPDDEDEPNDIHPVNGGASA